MSLINVVSILIAAICIPCIPLYFWKSANYIGELCNDCRAAIRAEQAPPIIVEAHNGMTAEELDELVDKMEALRDQRLSAMPAAS